MASAAHSAPSAWRPEPIRWSAIALLPVPPTFGLRRLATFVRPVGRRISAVAPKDAARCFGREQHRDVSRRVGFPPWAAGPYHRPVLIRAHAKVNLALAVAPPLSKELGGYHPIASWMAAIDLADEIELEQTGGPRSVYRVEWAADAPRATPIDWPIEKDLAARAHQLLEAHVGRALPVHLLVRKRTPVGGGLGGGSADAAAVLCGVNQLFQLGLSGSSLIALSARLGSDIGFFIDDGRAIDAPPRPALVSGLGQEIARVPTAGGGEHAAALVLLLPAFGCPTGPVYRAFDALGPGPLRAAQVRSLIDHAAAAGAIDSAALFNDLATPAEAVAPALGPIRRHAAAVLGVPVHVTGSGSTLFAIAPSAAAAQQWAEDLTRSAVDATAVVTRLA